MASSSHGDNAKWLIVAIPAAAILLPVGVALLIVAVKPAEKPEKPDKRVAIQTPAPEARPAPTIESPAPEPAPSPAPTAASPAVPPAQSSPVVEPAPSVTPPVPSALASNTGTSATARPPPPSSNSPPAGNAINLLASLDLGSSIARGDWSMDGNAVRCNTATNKNRGKLRLGPPPVGESGYDFAVTFTPQGPKPMLAQILSFRGRQFIFAMFASQSGFASVHGKNAMSNESTRPKGITADTKHTAVVKVRDKEISAYLDGEPLGSYTTDYTDLDVASAWNLGPSNTKQSLIGLAVESPVLIESIVLTPLDKQPAGATPVASSPTPAPASPPSSYKEMAAMISSAYSSESSTAATQPAARRALDPGKLQSLAAATSQPVADIAAGLLQPPGSAAPGATRPAGAADDAGARDALFRAVQLSYSPATSLGDPLLEARGPDPSASAIDRAEFDAEQARLAAWRKLAGRMGDLYPKAKPQSDLVKLQFVAPDYAKDKPASFLATHIGSEALTNVTLAIETVRALTSPSTTAVHYYFIPRWAPGQKIYFPVASMPNVSSPELVDSPGPSPLASRIGLMGAKAQLWSDQLQQQSQDTHFEFKLDSMARSQLNEAYRLVDEAMRRPTAASRPAGSPAPAPSPPSAARPTALIAGPIVQARADLDDNSPELARARAMAGRAALLGAQTPFADEAKTLAAQPLTALRDLRKRQVDAFINALGVRSTRNGVWVVHQPGMLAKLAKSSDREAALSAAGAAGGKVILTIDSRTVDGTNVGVTLVSTDQPTLMKKFAGRLQLDASSNRLLLNLRATQPPPTKPPAEGDLKRVIYWSSLLLELSGNNLNGIATAGPPESVTFLNVIFTGATAAPAPSAGGAKPPAKTAK